MKIFTEIFFHLNTTENSSQEEKHFLPAMRLIIHETKKILSGLLILGDPG